MWPYISGKYSLELKTLDEQDIIFFPVVNKTWSINIVGQEEVMDMYMLIRETWTWCIVHFKAYSRTEKMFQMGIGDRKNSHRYLGQVTTAWRTSACHPILWDRSVRNGQKLIFLFGENLCFFFSDFAFILHWKKRSNSQNSPSKSEPEKCHLGIVFQ